MILALSAGLVLTALVTGILRLVWGGAAILPGVAFGLLATAIQVASAVLVRRAAGLEFQALVKRWAAGMGMRVAGVAIFGVASWLRPEQFPPLPTAFAYLGVVVPLLFLEMRFLR